MNKNNPEKFTLYAIRLPVIYLNKLRKIKKLSHINISEQIRMSLRDYFIKMKRYD